MFRLAIGLLGLVDYLGSSKGAKFMTGVYGLQGLGFGVQGLGFRV